MSAKQVGTLIILIQVNLQGTARCDHHGYFNSSKRSILDEDDVTMQRFSTFRNSPTNSPDELLIMLFSTF